MAHEGCRAGRGVKYMASGRWLQAGSSDGADFQLQWSERGAHAGEVVVLRTGSRAPGQDSGERTTKAQSKAIISAAKDIARRQGHVTPTDVAMQLSFLRAPRPSPCSLRGILRSFRRVSLGVSPGLCKRSHKITWSEEVLDYFQRHERGDVLRVVRWVVGPVVTHFTLLLPRSFQFIDAMQHADLLHGFKLPFQADATFNVEWMGYVFTPYVFTYYRYMSGRWRKTCLPCVIQANSREENPVYKDGGEVLQEELAVRALPRVGQVGVDHFSGLQETVASFALSCATLSLLGPAMCLGWRRVGCVFVRSFKN